MPMPRTPGAFVSDAVVPQASALLRSTQRISETEIRVTHHAENGVDAPIRHHVHHLIHERRRLVQDG